MLRRVVEVKRIAPKSGSIMPRWLATLDCGCVLIAYGKPRQVGSETYCSQCEEVKRGEEEKPEAD